MSEVNLLQSADAALDSSGFKALANLEQASMDALPEAIYLCAGDGTVIRFNQKAAELWGRGPRAGDPTERFCGSFRMYRTDGTRLPHDECPMAIALRTGQSFHHQEVVVEQPSGERLTLLVNIAPFKDEDGQVIGAVNCFQDITSRKQGEAGLRDSERKVRELIDALPAAIYVTDAEGRITMFNQAAVEFSGRVPELGADSWCVSWKLYRADGTPLPHDECPMAIALKEGRPVRGEEAVAERPDGTRIPFLACPTPLFDESGNLSGAVNMLVDISGRKETELAAQKLAAIVEFSDDAILSKDINGIITSWNGGAERLFGYAEHEVLGKPVTILIPDDRQDEEPQILARIRRGERIDHYETVRRRKDGSLVDISLSVSPIVDPAGKIIGASKIARDITDRRRAEEQKDILLREMNHRVKNLFALANGMVSLSGRKANTTAALVSELQDRFSALSRAHSLTMPKDQDMGHVTTLHALIRNLTEPYAGDKDSEGRVVVSGPDLPIGPETVTNLALILHEFATNALKYGALSDALGGIRIECVDQGDNFSIVWNEHHKSLESLGPATEGFGSRLVRATIEGPLGGSFVREFKSDGIEIWLNVPRHRMSK